VRKICTQVPTCPQSPLPLNVYQRSKELSWLVRVGMFSQSECLLLKNTLAVACVKIRGRAARLIALFIVGLAAGTMSRFVRHLLCSTFLIFLQNSIILTKAFLLILIAEYSSINDNLLGLFARI